MKYDELLTKIATPILPHRYYELLLDSSTIIVMQVAKTSKKQVAQDLGMTPQVFATAYKFISCKLGA